MQIDELQYPKEEEWLTDYLDELKARAYERHNDPRKETPE